jgi:hypothetical protein
MPWFLDKKFLESLDLGAYDPAVIADNSGVPLDVARAFVDPARRYWVKSSPDYGWLAGASGNGRPCLLFVGEPRLASAVEHPLNAVSFDLPAGTVTFDAIPFADELSWDPVLEAAEAAVGFQHVGNCPILAFKHPTIWHYAVVPFPFHLHDDALGKGDGDREQVRAWIEAGSYVLHCGDAYFMSAEGDVESS